MSITNISPLFSLHLLWGGGGARLLTISVLLSVLSLSSSSTPPLRTDSLGLGTAGLIERDRLTGLAWSGLGERTWLDLALSSTGFLAIGGFLH